jgi:hypothetical protein
MPRRPQPPGTKGSLKWVQDVVNQHPQELERAIGHGNIEWFSPLASDEYAEYWDGSALDLLGLKSLRRPLSSFWPNSGPRWDALGRIRGGAAVLLEAKAHVPEMESTCLAKPRSRARIESAFREVWNGWRVQGSAAWLGPYYQYANRLAHAYFLNEVNSTPAFVVFLNFVGAAGMKGPAARADWEKAIQEVQEELGVHGKLPPYVLDAFIDVSGAAPRAV